MTSLRTCIRRAGKALDKADREAILAIQAELTGPNAGEQAIDEYLDELNDELSELSAEIDRAADGEAELVTEESAEAYREEMAEYAARPLTMEDFEFDENLSPAHKEQERAFAQAMIDRDWDSIVEEYKALSEKNGPEETKGGLYNSVDAWRELDPAYRNDRSTAAAVHEVASTLSKKYFAQVLSQPLQYGGLWSETIIFTSGGTGAGKSSGLRAARETLGEAMVMVFDGNLGKTDSGIKKFDQILKSGRTVFVNHTVRNAKEAFEFGALTRAIRQETLWGSGRTVPIWAHSGTHVGSGRALLELVAAYGSDERVEFVVTDNQYGKDKAIQDAPLASVLNMSDTELLEPLRSIIDRAYEHGIKQNGKHYVLSTDLYYGAIEEPRPEGAGQYHPNFLEGGVYAAAGQAQTDEREERQSLLGDGQESQRDDKKRAALRQAELQLALAPAIRALVGAAQVHIVPTVEDVPKTLDKNGSPIAIPTDVEGVYRGSNEFWLVASNLPTSERAKKVFAHEGFGHMAMERLSEFNDVLASVKNLLAQGNQTFVNVAEAVAQTQGNLNETTQAKEILAYMAEHGMENGVMANAYAAVRKTLRNWGLLDGAVYTEAEIKALLVRAARDLVSTASVKQKALMAMPAQKQILEDPNTVEQSLTLAIKEIYANATLQDMTLRAHAESLDLANSNDPAAMERLRALKRALMRSESAPRVGPEVMDPDALYSVAFHGTGAMFDRFDINYIGTGEGNQSYGWGLYFTSKRAVAEWYRRKLGGMTWNYGAETNIDRDSVEFYLSMKMDKAISGQAFNAAQQEEVSRSITRLVVGSTSRNMGNKEAIIAELENQKQNFLDVAETVDALDLDPEAKAAYWRTSAAAVDVGLEAVRNDLIGTTGVGGALMEVDVPDNDELLHYEDTIAEHSPEVQALLKTSYPELFSEQWVDYDGLPIIEEYFVQHGITIDFDPDALQRAGIERGIAAEEMTGDMLYEYIGIQEAAAKELAKGRTGQLSKYSGQRNRDKLASKKLESLGIPGHSFIGQGSDALNYVIYDDDVIQMRAINDQQVALAAAEIDQMFSRAGVVSETATNPAVPGKPFLAYRLAAADRSDLKNTNAGNAEGVAYHLLRASSDEGSQPAFGFGDTLHVYEVVADEFGDYASFISGSATNLSNASVLGVDGRPAVGRVAAGGFKGTAYSFADSGYTAELLESVPVAEVNQRLKDKTGNENFDWAGTALGSKLLRSEFEGADNAADFEAARQKAAEPQLYSRRASQYLQIDDKMRNQPPQIAANGALPKGEEPRMYWTIASEAGTRAYGEPKGSWEERYYTEIGRQASQAAKQPPPMGASPTDQMALFSRAPAVDTPAFKQWFGDSKIVDENGDPKVVYHGTKAEDFEAFRAKYDDNLIFFTTDSKFASKWLEGTGGLRTPPADAEAHIKQARETERRLTTEIMGDIDTYDYNKQEDLDRWDANRQLIRKMMKAETGFETSSQLQDVVGTRVIPVYLSIEKPFDPRRDWAEIESFLVSLDNLPNISGMAEIVANGNHKAGNWVVYEKKEVMDEIRSRGYDGIYLAENIGGPHDTIAAFDPEQAKSATGNRGTFDATDPNMLYSRRNKSGAFWNNSAKLARYSAGLLPERYPQRSSIDVEARNFELELQADQRRAENKRRAVAAENPEDALRRGLRGEELYSRSAITVTPTSGEVGPDGNYEPGGRAITVLKNPSLSELEAFVNYAAEGDSAVNRTRFDKWNDDRPGLRYMKDNNSDDWYFWDAADAIHSGVRNGLGLMPASIGQSENIITKEQIYNGNLRGYEPPKYQPRGYKTPAPRPLYSRFIHPDETMEQLRARVLSPALEDITIKDRLRAVVERIKGTEWLGIKQGLIDSAASVEELEKGLFGRLLDASESAYKSILATRNLGSVMAAIMHRGIPEYVDGVFRPRAGRKGLIDIFQNITHHKDGNLLPLWELYAVAKRSQRLITEKNPDGTLKEKNLTQADIDKALTLENEYPEFKTAFMEWQKFNSQLLDLAIKRGFINGEEAKVWRKNDYVPFYRAMEELEFEGGQGPQAYGEGVANVRPSIRRLSGSEAPIGNVFENMVMNTSYLIDGIYRNTAMQRVVAMADGIAMNKLPMAWEAIKFKDADIARALMRAGLIVGRGSTEADMLNDGIRQVKAMTPEQKEHWSTLFRRVAPTGPNVVSVLIEGKPAYFEVTDPLLLRSIGAMGAAQFGGVMNMFRFAKRTLTKAVTIDPAFMMANFIRDTLSSSVVLKGSGAKQITGAIQGLKAAWTEDEDILDMMMAGAGGGGFYDHNPADVRKMLAKKMPEGQINGFMNSVLTPRGMWRFWQKIGNASEQANRVAIYKRVIAEGGTPAEAAHQARDVLNFTMSGDYAAMKLIVQSVPFINARIQGLYRLSRGAQENPVGFAMKGLTITAATLVLLLKNRDDERYQALPEWDKDTYWHFFVGDEHFRLPKPFEVGAIFGTIPERMVMLGTGDDDFDTTIERGIRMLADTFAFNPIPQAVKPIQEQYSNRNMFTGNPIVGMALEGLEPEAQYDPWTSETTRELAKILPGWGGSPKRLEAFIRGYFGTVGMYALTASDSVTRRAFGHPDRPTKDIRNYPVLTRFWRDPNPRTSKYATQLYDMMGEADSLYKTMNAYRDQRRVDEAAALMKENRGKLATRAFLHDIASDVRKINAKMKQIQFSALPADQKKERLDQLNKTKLALMSRVARVSDMF